MSLRDTVAKADSAAAKSVSQAHDQAKDLMAELRQLIRGIHPRVLTDRGLPVEAGDGVSVWVPLPVPARDVAERLTRRGWLVRTGEEFRLEASEEPSQHLRLTVHDLSPADAEALAQDLTEAVAEIG